MAKEFEFKGTHGKWEVRKVGGCIIVQKVDVVCHVLDNNEAKANALLISKAPEMLEMLIIGKQVLEDFGLDVEQLIKEATTL